MDDKLPVIDAAKGVEAALGNPQMWRTVLGMLLQSLPDSLAQMRAHFAAGDREALRKAAHKLHGASSFCGVPQLQQAAKTLELACQDDLPPARIGAYLEALAAAIARLEAQVGEQGMPAV